jgi:K+-transporting ATPase ATPase C chain
MKTLIQSLKITFISIVFFCIIYPLIVLGIAKFISPNNGKGEILSYGNSKYGYANIGQSFTDDKYFWSRPSAVGYNATGSGASNKGPSNPDYLKTISANVDTFIMKNPDIKKEDIPSESVTASGSGLDPDISPNAALMQVSRIANARKISEEKIIDLINHSLEKPLLNLFGPPKINVLKLNISLDNLK